MSFYSNSASDITPNANHATVNRLGGFSIRESAAAAAAAAVNIRHGSATGQILAVLELAANESVTVSFQRPFDAPSGVYVEVVSGTVSGVLHEWV